MHKGKSSHRHIEFLLVFFLLPLLFVFKILPTFMIVPILWIVSIYIIYLYRKKDKKIFKKKIKKKHLKTLFFRTLMVFSSLLIFTFVFYEDKLFRFMIENFNFYFMIVILYPIVSVVPQELIFRKFFVDRYKFDINENSFIFLNALVFGFVHLIYGNFIAVIFSIAGGYLFITTYLKTRSLALVSLEHAIYGNLIFTIGLGEFFYNGNSF